MTKAFYDEKDIFLEDEIRFLNLEIRARLGTYVSPKIRNVNIAALFTASDFTAVATLIDFWLDTYELIPAKYAYAQPHSEKT